LRKCARAAALRTSEATLRICEKSLSEFGLHFRHEIVAEKSVGLAHATRIFGTEAKASRQQVRLQTTALRKKVRAFSSIGGGGCKRQNPAGRREAKAERWNNGNALRNSEKNQARYAR
jgi:hypothetical protein